MCLQLEVKRKKIIEKIAKSRRKPVTCRYWVVWRAMRKLFVEVGRRKLVIKAKPCMGGRRTMA
jgi:hypothetical protein